MKKALSLVLCCAMLLSCVAVANAESYTATAKGFGGDVTVTLEITDGKLTAVTAVGANETSGIGSNAIDKMPDAMVKANSVDVDGVTGATFTSNAILEAAKEALAQSGVTLTAADTEDATAVGVEVEAETTDVLVIGGGAAGLAASISAAENGASVILVEKLSFLGGCSKMSGGVFTRASVESDGENAMTGDELYEFLMECSNGLADADLVRTYVDKSVDTFNWCYDNMISDAVTTRYAMIPDSIVSIWMPDSWATKFVSSMETYAAGKNVDIRLSTPATELIIEDGAVKGAVVTNADGSVQKIYAKGGVVLATGGFASSPEKLAQYSSAGAETIISYASAGVTGDGLDMAAAANAEIHFNDDWDTCGAFGLALKGYATAQMHYPMLLNAAGDRFVNEANIQPTIYTAMRHEIAKGYENKFWWITDSNIESDPDQIKWLEENVNAVTVNTVEEMAEVTGIPAEKLQATIDVYNAAAGTDNDAFGKPADYNKGISAPYTIIADEPWRTTTIGGLTITIDAEVKDTDGNPIPGLYAAGEVANANFYGTVYTCGTAFGSAIVFGRIAGANAAAKAQ